ncbi:MAG: NRDE family protein [Phycisphaerales bacterium]
MCTVSIIPFALPHAATAPIPIGSSHGAPTSHAQTVRPLGFRIVTNRDELRTRPPAIDPAWHDFEPGGRRAIYPIDPAGGGTWIGGSTSGLVLCLLNGNPIPAPTLPPKSKLVSRGVIIPRLFARAGSDPSLSAVLANLASFDLSGFAPFRLVAVTPSADPARHGFVAVEASWDRTELIQREHPTGPACFVSSGLGDPLVKPRITLFNELVRASRSSLADLPAAQDRFHRHTWTDRTEISVMMSRREARTVSITSIEVSPTVDAEHAECSLLLEYEPIDHRAAASPAHADQVVPAAAKHRVVVPARVARRAQ